MQHTGPAMRFDGRVALVTGAGGGLGRAHATLLASRGAQVVVNDPGTNLAGDGRDHRPAQHVVDEIRQAGGDAVASFGSVASTADTAQMIELALDVFGRIDIVVNNAGNFVNARPFAETSSDSFLRLWQVHVLGSVNTIRAAWPYLIAQHYGRIVNTASHSGYLGAPSMVEYGAAKSAVHGLTRSLSLEAIQHGIQVNAIAPGARTRPVAEHYPNFPVSPAFAAELVSPTVAWLAHESCNANGEIFTAIAGTTARIRVGESDGYQSRTPTPEGIRDHADEIFDQAAFDDSQITFAVTSPERGSSLIARFEASPTVQQDLQNAK